ncbi:hypothetical protein Hdeb2414_s0006g00204361 [Helianthus debilis subsp. tardiflorus]
MFFFKIITGTTGLLTEPIPVKPVRISQRYQSKPCESAEIKHKVIQEQILKSNNKQQIKEKPKLAFNDIR